MVLLVKIDEDEANGMLLSIQTGLCYLVVVSKL